MKSMRSVFVLSLALVFLGMMGGWLYSRHALFRVRLIEVKGLESSLKSRIDNQLIDYSGRSMFSIGLNELESKLMKNAEIKSLQILRVWPDQLIIEAIQKEPVALEFNQNELWIVGEDGERIHPLKKAKALPLLVGFAENDQQRNKVSFWIYSMNKNIPNESLFHWIDEVEWQNEKGVVLKLQSLDLRIDLGEKFWTQRWRRSELTYVALRERGIRAQHLDASNDPRVFVYRSAELHKSKSGLNLSELVHRTRDVRPEAR